ncbi:MAG TPA: winged helix DNA-binding domain-containing protein [Candidatus Limnocylindria bacterium]|nr:winged helix DNA-binding domain-containing protein [Candidatus Limnocylindria bacterium]
MKLTARQLNRATLDRQLLLRRRRTSVVEAVDAVCALQAQSPASPYLALWNRISGFDAAGLDRAFAARQLVKATLMRLTKHVVTARAYPAVWAALVPDLRRARLYDERFTVAGLSIEETDALVPALHAWADQGRASAEFEAWIAERAGVPGRPVWWALRHIGPFVYAPTGGPWSFGDRSHFSAPSSTPYAADRAAAMAHLVRSYLGAFGPATEADLNQFTMMPMPPIRDGLAVLADELVSYEGPNGKPLLDLRGAHLPPEDAMAPPRFLGMWDEILLAYRDRSRVITPEIRSHVSRLNGDTLPTVLVDGYVAGVWRPAPGSASGVEVTALRKLDAATWTSLEREAGRLVRFLSSREPNVYARYAHWWSKLPPDAEVRVLAA